MARLQFCADEHVPHAFVTALDSNGFTVIQATVERGEETVDDDLLSWCRSEELVLLTNDRDFAELDRTREHAGIVVYTNQTQSPAEFVRRVRRIDRQFTLDSITDQLVWLEQWS